MAELRLFHGHNFVRHLGICIPICVKLLQIMSGVILRNFKKKVSISNSFSGVHKRGIHTDTQTHTDTHDDSIRRNAMRCISPKNDHQLANVCLHGEVLVHHDTQTSGHAGRPTNAAIDYERTVVEIMKAARGRQPKKQ